MSKTIFEETKNLPSVTIFWGGKKKGKCIQLTKAELVRSDWITGTAETVEHYYITVPIKAIHHLIKRLNRVKRL